MTGSNDSKAGSGQPHVYVIPSTDGKGAHPLQANTHYISVDVVSWYVNRDSSWYESHSASGTVEISLLDGREVYRTALGTFELAKGQTVASVFEKSALPDRNYRGGSIGIAVSLVDFPRDAPLMSLLKTAASTSLSIAAGMVQTASLAGPQKVLADAGVGLAEGVRKALGERKGAINLFGSGVGIDCTIRPDQVTGPETYFLFHRGAELKGLSIAQVGEAAATFGPLIGAEPLRDGAWLLLRVSKRDTYSGYREWFEVDRKLVLALKDLLQEVAAEDIAKDEALKRLAPSEGGARTLFDEFRSLREAIRADGVMTEVEALARSVNLSARVAEARKAIKEDRAAEVVRGGLKMAVVSTAESSDPIVASTVREFEEIRGAARPAAKTTGLAPLTIRWNDE